MLSFNSNLTNALTLRNTQTFWVLKLYYNDESSFIGVSDTHRNDGADTYYGLVTLFGNYSQSLDFFNFTASIGNMTIKLVNSQGSFQGGRFSDQLATNNFANRKWELFQCINGLTFDTAANMIASGVISGDINFNRNEVVFHLLDFTSRYHKRLPTTVVDASNAPEKNINKPVPMCYGSFHDKTGIGTIPTSGAEFDRHYTKSKFPAIITDKWDKTNAYVKALVDNETPETLDTKNIYMKTGDTFAVCKNGTNTTASSNQITVKGMDWRAYVSPTLHNTYVSETNYGQTYNQDFRVDAPYTLTQAGAGSVSVGWRIPKIPRLGVFSGIKLLFSFGTFSGTSPSVDFRLSKTAGGVSLDTLTWDTANQEGDIEGLYSSGEKDSWDLEQEVFLTLDNTAGSGTKSVVVAEVGIEIQLEPSQSFDQEVREQYEIWGREHDAHRRGKINFSSPVVVGHKVVSRTITNPVITDYLYFSGEGRQYFSAIDTARSNGYASSGGSDPIENPIYIVEDMIRTELELTSIDATTFDQSGNSTDGFIKDVFDLSNVTDIKFAGSQYKFIDSKGFMDKIGKQCCSWFFISGNGDFKVATRRKPADYTSADKTVDFGDITLDFVAQTPLPAVSNDITINYNYHYGQGQTLSRETATDATSKGTGASGFSQTLKFEMDADFILDADTAGATANKGLAAALLAMFKDRHTQIMFDCPSAKYSDLEIGDVITFSNWDSNIKIFGTAFDSSNNFFMVTSTNKRPNGCEVTCTEVSD